MKLDFYVGMFMATRPSVTVFTNCIDFYLCWLVVLMYLILSGTHHHILLLRVDATALNI